MIASILAMWIAVATLIAIGERWRIKQPWYAAFTLTLLGAISAITSITAVYLAWRYLP